jgi:hypothetical protein
VTANDSGWTSMQTIVAFGMASLMFALFFRIQRRRKEPLIPTLLSFIHDHLIFTNIIFLD